MKKKLLALFVTLCMMLTSLGVAALATEITTSGPQSEIEVPAEVVNPVYRLTVPTSYEFSIDPFEQVDPGTMIFSSDFYFINKSNVAVQLDVDVKLEALGDTTLDLKDTKAGVTANDETKQLWFAAVASTSSLTTTEVENVALKTASEEAVYRHGAEAPYVYNTVETEGVAVTFTDTTGVEGDYGTFSSLDDTSDGVVTIGDTNAKMTYALAKADGYTLDDGTRLTGAVAASDAGVTAFRFIGAVNSNATWLENEISAKVKYTLTGKSDASYTLLTDSDNSDGYAAIPGAHALVKKVNTSFAPAPTPTPTPPPAPTITLNGTISKSTGGTFNVANVDPSDTIASITITDGVQTSTLQAAAYTWTGATGTLALLSERIWYDNLGANCTITVTFTTAGPVTGSFTKQ